MKIILLKQIDQLGKPYDIVTVKDGYARNYLFPKNLAIPATDANVRGMEKTRKRFSQKIGKVRRMSMDLSEQINNTSVKTAIKMGIDGKSFGSITSQHLVELLQAEGVEIDKKNIVLEEPIKQPGVYDIKVNLGENIHAAFKVVVLEEGD